MNIQKRNKRSAEFSMSSMTDIVFLLLIFFMLTSTLVSPNALKLLLPKGNVQTAAKSPRFSVSVDVNENYYFGNDKVSLEELRMRLQNEVADVSNPEDMTVIFHAESGVRIDPVVSVMSMASKMKIRMVLATEKE